MKSREELRQELIRDWVDLDTEELKAVAGAVSTLINMRNGSMVSPVDMLKAKASKSVTIDVGTSEKIWPEDIKNAVNKMKANTIGSLTVNIPQMPPMKAEWRDEPKQEKEHEMCYMCDLEDGLPTEKSYLKGRVDEVYFEKQNDGREKFNLNDDEAPRTVRELVKRIQDGNITLPSEDKDTPTYLPYALDRIKWRNPDRKPDEKGYEEFEEKLNDEKTRVVDTIVVFDSSDGLKALREFENFPVE